MSRAAKSGLAAEAHEKVKSKFNPDMATEILMWINRTSDQNLNTNGEMNDFVSTLKDGVALCKLANALKPGAIRKINETSMAFKQMENINNFLAFCEQDAQISKTEVFATVDLYEAQDPNSVIMCLSALARKAEKFGKQPMGPRESHGERKEWTPEQLKAGEGIIGLQAGSNKFATQSGMNMGKTRKIID
uniref:Transgelin n=1 Tax=Romanomermis culicivorax TaxID=13658 RepID=A0A915IVI7_ROMCU